MSINISINDKSGYVIPPFLKWQRLTLDDINYQLPRVITNRVWSGCVWKEDEHEVRRRSKENLDEVSLLVYDFDSHEEAQPKDIVKQIERRLDAEKLWYIIGATKSHTAEKPGLRVIIGCDTILLDHVFYTHTLITTGNKLLAGLKWDTQAVDAARLWNPCKTILAQSFYNFEIGHIIDTESIPPKKIPKAKKVNIAAKLLANKGNNAAALKAIILADADTLNAEWGNGQHIERIKLLTACKAAGFEWEDVSPLMEVLNRNTSKYEKQFAGLNVTTVPFTVLHCYAKRVNNSRYAYEQLAQESSTPIPSYEQVEATKLGVLKNER